MGIRASALLAVLCLNADAQSTSVFIETIAGAATFDNRLARNTPLVQPQAVWINQINGDIFVSDGNFVVRRIRNGNATIVAGGGSVVDDSLPIPGKAANLDYPNGLAGGPSGELYISDVNHNRVQRLNADGTIVTVVGKGTAGYSGDGGRGTFAELDHPSALALSASGDLFIADKFNAVVRKYNIRTGIITTYAGNGEFGYSGDGRPAILARIGTVESIAVDAIGNLYLADTRFDNNGDAVEVRIRRVTLDGVIATYAGSGPIDLTGDDGPAIGAKLKRTFGMAIDIKGNLFIADADTIRVVTAADRIIRRYAGQADTVNSGIENVPATQAYLNTPGLMALDAAGNLFFPESTGDLVRRIDATTKLITTFAGTSNPFDGTRAETAPLNRPTSVTADRSGNLYIVDAGHFRVRRIDAVTGLISTIAGDGKSYEDVNATNDSFGNRLVISVDPLNRLLIADQDEGGIYSVNLNTGRLRTLYDGYDDYVQPAGVAGDASGNVYFSDWNHDKVMRISPDGSVTTFAGIGYHGQSAYSGDGGPADQAEISGPRGLLIDDQGRVLICDTDNHVVRRVNPSTGIIRAFAGDHLDNSDYDGHPATQASLRAPVALAQDSYGRIYIADRAAHEVRVVINDGNIYTAGGGNGRGFAGDGGPAILSLFDTPLGVATSDNGVFVSDSFNYRIRRLFFKSIQNDPVVDPPRLSFRATFGGDDPSAQFLTVNSSYLGLNLDYTINDLSADWLYGCTLTQGTDCYHGSTPDLVEVEVDTTDLAVGKYSGTLVVSADGSPDVNIPVDLIIDPPNVVTSVTPTPSTVRFAIPPNVTSIQQVTVSAAGKAPVGWSIRRQTDSPWLKFSASAGTTPATVNVAADSTGLRPGTYQALCYFVKDGGASTLFVASLNVTDARPAMQLDRDSMLFEAVEGTTAASPQPVRIYNTGAAPLSWQLTLPALDDQQRSPTWLRPSAVKDIVAPGGAPSLVNIAVDPAGLRAGNYSVPIAITAPGAAGAPQILGVRLRVLPAGTPAKAVFDKTALLFRGSPGSAIADQTLELSSTGGPLTFSTSVRPAGAGQWLSVTPASGSVLSSAQRSILRFKITNTSLEQGVYNGGVKFSFSDGTVREVGVTFILRAGAGVSASGLKERSAGCEPSRQVLVVPTLSANFALTVGWPVPIQAQVFDDCGSPSASSSVTVTFDNGDPVMTLKNVSGGNYSGTWTPASVGAGGVSVTMQALRPGLTSDEWRSTGRLARGPSTPPILSAVLNDASRVNTSLIAPGGRIVLQGANFPDLPADVSVQFGRLSGSLSAKVLSRSATSLQVVAPASLDGISQTYVVVTASGFTTSPQTVSVVPVDPGLYALPDGMTASPGASLAVTATGLGAVDSTGRLSPLPTAKLGNLDAIVTSATAGVDGLYQLRITIPAGASGDMQLTVTQSGVASNPIAVNVR